MIVIQKSTRTSRISSLMHDRFERTIVFNQILCAK